jgi:hypothetical protein
MKFLKNCMKKSYEEREFLYFNMSWGDITILVNSDSME